MNIVAARKRVTSARNHYELLGVPPGATPGQLTAARREMALACHPDRAKAADASDLMARINVAYGVLSDPAQRKTYDLVHHTNTTACAKCAGTGETYKQRGFRLKVAQPCPACGGTGLG